MQKEINIESYIAKHLNWKDALLLLQEILRSFELDETIKWDAPVYTLSKKT
jgi:uncharacterized protein YdeI (YjbR/CyaY-like superfamily)